MADIATKTMPPMSATPARISPRQPTGCGCWGGCWNVPPYCAGFGFIKAGPPFQSSQAVRLVAAQREVLAERVPLPVVGQEDAAQVRVTVEDDAEHVERLALVPVGRAPDGNDGRDVRVLLVQENFQAQAVEALRREEVVVDLEARLLLRPAVGAGDVREHVELEARRGLQVRAQLRDAFAR